MDGYSNLFLAVGIAVSLFLVVHHVGHSVIRYLNRCKNCIVKNKARERLGAAEGKIAIAGGVGRECTFVTKLPYSF